MAEAGVQKQAYAHAATTGNGTTAPIHAAPFCAGPWLIAIAAISIVGMITDDLSLIRLLRSFAISVIIAGPISFVAAHFTARQMANDRRGRIFPALVGALTVSLIASVVLGIGTFFLPAETTDRLSRTVAVVLQCYITLNFVVISFLAVFRKIRSLAIVGLAGLAISFFAAATGARMLMEAGMLIGFAIGQIVLFIALIRLALHEFGRGYGAFATWEIFRALKKFRLLAWSGFFLSFGIFVDKFIPFPIAADWKIATVALLSIVPGVTWFFLHLRTDLTPALHTFANAMSGGEPLDTIHRAKEELLYAFTTGFTQVLFVQGMVTAALVFWAESVSIPFPFFDAATDTMLFRVALVGAFLLVVFVSLLAILLQLNDTRSAFKATAVFALTNLVLSLATHFFMPQWEGFGFVLASAAALLISVSAANNLLNNLEFWEWKG